MSYITLIIPVEKKTAYVLEALKKLEAQDFKDFEVLIATTKPFTVPYSWVQIILDKTLKGNVSAKRNEILKHGRGSIFIFHDDDVYVPPDYLAQVVQIFKNKKILAAAGPLLTPPNDTLMQQASGIVWNSYLGMGSFGAELYRSRKQPKRLVYDFPAANLIIRADVFKKLNGYESGMYPGEDTKLCLDIANTYKTGIRYDPLLYVYHHRKALFLSHLQQIGRYAHQRGWFAITYPETSFKLHFFVPSLLVGYSIFALIFGYVNQVLLFPMVLYWISILIQAVVLIHTHGFVLGVLGSIGVVTTHYYYGTLFMISFSRKIINRLWSFVRLVN